MNSQLLLWSWKVADCSLVDNLIAKKLRNFQQLSMTSRVVWDRNGKYM